MDSGGSILMTLGEGGEAKNDTNVNFFLEQYGVAVNSDAIVRSSFYKYFHPKECIVSSGVLNRELGRVVGKPLPTKGSGQAGANVLHHCNFYFLPRFDAILSLSKWQNWQS
jgi:intraflagellar transport protein 52